MEFGVSVLNFGGQSTPETLIDWVVNLERLGFAAAFFSDHVVLTDDVVAKYPPPFFDPFVAAGVALASTSRIRLGTSVAVLPYRDPHHTARLAHNLSAWGARPFILGVGVGWSRQEFTVLGRDFGQRGRQTNRSLEIVRKALSGEVIEDPVRIHPPGPGDGAERPQIWVGGASPAALRRAVRFGDAWHPIYPSIEVLRRAVHEDLPRLCAQTGATMPVLAPRVRLGITHAALPQEGRRLGEGNLAQVREDLHGLAEQGARWIVFDTYAGSPDRRNPSAKDWEQVELLCAEVIDPATGTLR